jgi:hypothetical protein
MKTMTVNFRNNSVKTIGFTKDGTINLYEAGLQDMYCKDEIMEYIHETEGQDVSVIFEDDVRPGQYTVLISDLEELGWDFTDVYDATARALNVSDKEAKKYNNSKYNVVVTINENGSTEYRLDAGSEFSSNEPTGDDKQTIKDVEGLIASGDIISFNEN